MKAWFNLFLFSGYFLCILMAVSCCGRRESKGAFVLPEYPDPLDSCLSPALQECLRLYPPLACAEDLYYINVEFFQKDTFDYFTISIRETDFKRHLERMNPGVKYDYYWFQYYGADIVFAKKHDDKRVLPFKPCISLIPSEDIDYIPDKEIIVRDSFWPRTYRYYFDGKRYRIEGLRDTIYSGYPPTFPQGREVFWMQQENKRLGLDPRKPYPQI